MKEQIRSSRAPVGRSCLTAFVPSRESRAVHVGGGRWPELVPQYGLVCGGYPDVA